MWKANLLMCYVHKKFYLMSIHMNCVSLQTLKVDLHINVANSSYWCLSLLERKQEMSLLQLPGSP